MGSGTRERSDVARSALEVIEGERVERVRIIDWLRTAHLERLTEMVDADVLYGGRRYDFDESLLSGERPPRQAGRFGTVFHLLRHRYDYAELNEPLMRRRWWWMVPQILALRLRNRGRRRTVISAYCIGLTDPVASYRGRRRLPGRLDEWYVRAMLRLLVGSFDRLAFGTRASRDLLEHYVDPRVVARRARDFPAVSCPCGCLAGSTEGRDPNRVLFVGAFDDRKGIRELMALWEALPEAEAGGLKLHVVGKGQYRDEVERWAEGRADVELTIDPPRAEVHRAYRRAGTLVLLSQRVGHWREQVGLPILEGLAHGCLVVTTRETGIASWLAEHRHVVLDPALPAPAAATELVTALRQLPARDEVLADLPQRDSRLVADDWLMGADEDRGNAGIA